MPPYGAETFYIDLLQKKLQLKLYEIDDEENEKKKSANKKIIKLLEMKNKIKPSFHANVFPELSCELLPTKDGERINK